MIKYGRLHVSCGPMFAGKTEGLVKELLFHTYFDKGDIENLVGVYKPAFDTRSDADAIVSHDGKTVYAEVLEAPRPEMFGNFKTVFFDEVQFFVRPHFEGDFIEMIRRLRHEGTDVYCSGLDMDVYGRAFEITSQVMAESTSITRLTARCDRCGAPATHTARTDGNGPRLDVGGKDKYAPMCANHWFELTRGVLQ